MGNKKSILVVLIAILGCLSPVAAIPSSEIDKVYRLLILDSQAGSPYEDVRNSLIETLMERGYRQGDNLEITHHYIDNSVTLGVDILKREITEDYDVVYVGGTVATISAKNALFESDVPVVFGAPTDPIGIGVIDSFDQPPKVNFTGVSYPVPVKSRFLFLRQLMPELRRVGLIYADMPQSQSYNRWIKRLLMDDPAFHDIEVIFHPLPLITGDDGDEQMAKLAIPIIKQMNNQVDAFLKPNDQLGARQHFAEVVKTYGKKPLIGLVKKDVVSEWGATAVVFPCLESMGRQLGEMVYELFDGVPIEFIEPKWPAHFGYAVDLNKTQQFGINVPVGILQLAGKNIIR
ncbi:MAG: hypothetical protein JAY99_05795 [Candidatus Thiodiazotropha lotti]|uniref:ABC transporter substrate-binding protein n=1 Tax=Candidatus Thiodiazotropha endoloripes TaxID=1818881 RepID=A0A1E2URS1_9GAMM|nr:ABC transporter substrate binding protein [Candidatus Thiodiazotropha endoloripes]MCG7897894.1 hypothetical protein [Candidatus Thiodiazotropha weberae]MCG7990348.1 hypothetical protein [Candidatus Thiodiazotropha lotti]MCG7902644.1 hypothetical protein [Candidatus Thiodiazotropha weberae]MCG7999015.1 hypothetical protein [Candidatus Thiodiazotropha lotti]MCW4182002.1 hypothetical protein [Candidatus Thiodiazotropha weberae]